MADITKLWIAKTMQDLMRYNSIEKIRVTEICKAAEIERPTFYYHFKDKYDLLAWIFYHDAYTTDIVSVESGAESLRKVKSDVSRYKKAYEDPNQNALWKCMLEYFVKRYTDIAKAELGTDELEEQIAYSIRFYCMGAVGMTREWVLYDDKTPAEKIVRMIFASMPDRLRKIILKESLDEDMDVQEE